jgi:hypothetical protein
MQACIEQLLQYIMARPWKTEYIPGPVGSYVHNTECVMRVYSPRRGPINLPATLRKTTTFQVV